MNLIAAIIWAGIILWPLCLGVKMWREGAEWPDWSFPMVISAMFIFATCAAIANMVQRHAK